MRSNRDECPDFRTISEFRKRHLAALSGLFRQVLAVPAGLVKLGHVALDGTKIKANAGINKAMSYAGMTDYARGPILGKAEFLAVSSLGADQSHNVGLL